MKKKVLIAGKLIKNFTHIYKKHFDIKTLWDKDIKKINFSDFDAFVPSGDFKIPDSHIGSCEIIKSMGPTLCLMFSTFLSMKTN